MIYFMDASGFSTSYLIRFQQHTINLNLVCMDTKFQALKELKKMANSFKNYEDIQGGFQNFVIRVWFAIDNGA